MTRTGRTGGGRANCGGRADGRRTGGQADVGQRRGGRADGGRMGRRADGRMRADGARTGRSSGRADGQTSRGFKRPRTSFSSSLSSAQTTRLTIERVCRALGSALGSQPGLCYFFFAPNNIFAIQAQQYCEVYARIVLALSRIVIQNLWKERTIPWFRQY